MSIFISPFNEYPRHAGDIYIDHPDFDGINLPYGWKQVNTVNMPEIEFHQGVEENFPELINGEYFQSWSVRDLTEEELENKIKIRDEYLI